MLVSSYPFCRSKSISELIERFCTLTPLLQDRFFWFFSPQVFRERGRFCCPGTGRESRPTAAAGWVMRSDPAPHQPAENQWPWAKRSKGGTSEGVLTLWARGECVLGKPDPHSSRSSTPSSKWFEHYFQLSMKIMMIGVVDWTAKFLGFSSVFHIINNLFLINWRHFCSCFWWKSAIFKCLRAEKKIKQKEHYPTQRDKTLRR